MVENFVEFDEWLAFVKVLPATFTYISLCFSLVFLPCVSPLCFSFSLDQFVKVFARQTFVNDSFVQGFPSQIFALYVRC